MHGIYNIKFRVCDSVCLQHLSYTKSVHICQLSPSALCTQSYTLTQPEKKNYIYQHMDGLHCIFTHSLSCTLHNEISDKLCAIYN